jgi:DNA ligase-1
MTKHKEIYKRDSKGKIRVWYIVQDEGQYRTHAGVQDGGNLVVSKWKVVKPTNVGRKNETSTTQQATSEIESKYEDKLTVSYCEDVNDVDLPRLGVPMLSERYKDHKAKVNFGTQSWGLQCKFNGHRCYADKNGLWTRKCKRYLSVPHIEEALKPFFEQYPNAVLDGEFFNPDYRQQLNKLAKIIARKVDFTDEHIRQSEEMVRYYIYDGYGFNTALSVDAPYWERKAWITRNVIGKYKYTEQVDTHAIQTEGQMHDLYEILCDEGHEGAILRNLDSGYEKNKRSRNLLKLKPEDDAEADIIAIHEGTGNWGGVAKTATLLWNGKKFDATFKGSYAELKVVLNNPQDWIDHNLTFLYNGLTGLGTPNYARIDIHNCNIDRQT